MAITDNNKRSRQGIGVGKRQFIQSLFRVSKSLDSGICE